MKQSGIDDVIKNNSTYFLSFLIIETIGTERLDGFPFKNGGFFGVFQGRRPSYSHVTLFANVGGGRVLTKRFDRVEFGLAFFASIKTILRVESPVFAHSEKPFHHQKTLLDGGGNGGRVPTD